MRDAYDVVIAGGGVTGCSTACFLAADPDFDGRVLVVEREPSYEHAPSARSTGGFRQQFSTPENVRIGLFGAHFLEHVGEYLGVDGEVPDVGLRERGYLLLAAPPMLETMRANHAVQREHGAQVSFLAPAAIADRFPWIAPGGLAGGFLGERHEGWVDPYSLLQAYRRKARAAGVEFAADEVVDLERGGARVAAVRLRDAGRVAAGAVVNAAGASGGAALCARAGFAIPVESRKRCTFVFECRAPIEGAPLTILPEGIAFRPEGRGFIANVAPPPGRDPDTRDVDVDYALFDEIIWPALAERVPAFEAIKLAGAWCCHYDYNTLDENLVVGRAPELENLWLALGFSGHGLQQSPAVGRALSELIAHGAYRTLDLSRFGYERIARGEPLRETNCY